MNAIDVANSLNSTSNALQKLRAEADADINTAVVELNRLLKEFKTYNDKVRQGTAAGTDVNDALDQRDKLLTGISAIIGVTTVNRTNNDLALYTSDGTVLAPRGDGAAYSLPAGAQTIRVDVLPQDQWWLWVQGAGLLVLVFLAIPLGNRASRRRA